MRRLRRFFSHWQNWVALVLVLFFIAVAIAAPVLSPMDPRNPGPYKIIGDATRFIPNPPDEVSPLGTLSNQRDVYHSIVWGARDALTFGLLVTFGAACFGIVYGAIAGYAGGFLNRTMMRIADAFLAFPVIAGVVLLQQLVLSVMEASGELYGISASSISGQPSLLQQILAHVDPLLLSLIVFSWMPYARLINTMVITLKQVDFVQAARALGAGPGRIIFGHLIPNSISPAVVLAARDVGSMVILQATLTYIGVAGGSPWGTILLMGRDWIIGPGGSILIYWWVFVPATLAVILFGIGWNLLGDGLNDLLDPRYR